jgi:hypothetical protein
MPHSKKAGICRHYTKISSYTPRVAVFSILVLHDHISLLHFVSNQYFNNATAIAFLPILEIGWKINMKSHLLYIRIIQNKPVPQILVHLYINDNNGPTVYAIQNLFIL